jgi:hypothetical protein
LQKGGIVTGKVTTSNGIPVVNAEIYVSGLSYGESTYTDENGNYRLERLLAGSYILNVNPPYNSDLISNSTVISVDLEETVTTDIILQKGGIVTGMVTTSNGTTVVNAEIYVSGPNYRSTYTDENGNYRLEGLLAGSYILNVNPPYNSDLIGNSTTFNVDLEETVTTDIIMQKGGIVTGKITTSNGTPVVHAEIYVSGPSYRSTYTNENGNYRLGGLLAGSYILTVNPPYDSDLIGNSTTFNVDLEETVTTDIIMPNNGDWRDEWMGEDSEEGTTVTTNELQEAIHHWLDDIPVRKHTMSTADLQQIISVWLSG